MTKTGQMMTPRVINPSRATLHPHARLMAAMVVQACDDLRGDNPILALDALNWLMEDSAMYMEALDFETTAPAAILGKSLRRFSGKGKRVAVDLGEEIKSLSDAEFARFRRALVDGLKRVLIGAILIAKGVEENGNESNENSRNS